AMFVISVILSEGNTVFVNTDGVSVFVMERDSVTFQTDVKTNQQGRIRWYFNDIRIAQITGDLRKICTDVQCNNYTESFRDRLKLDKQTGSLSITNIRTTDAGLFQLRISSTNNGEGDKTFSFAVHDISAAEQDEIKKKEGENVTLYSGEISQNDLLRWYFNDTLIVEITGDQSKICADDQCEDRFRDRLKLDHQTGSLTITNTRTTDSGVYQQQIYSSRISIIRSFTVSVTVAGEYHLIIQCLFA
uniref:Immunoglobulin domain-containing protein n=1 Tax=Sinocyclocheilus anshuiensis TaxID=1608454 RepID=A0A671M378_9TELE